MKPSKQLAVAAGAGDLDTMRALLAADPTLAKDWQPIMDACYAGRAEAVRLLLDHGADPNAVSKSTYRYRPLHRTIERKVSFPRTDAHLEVVKLLLERGADPLAPGTYFQVSALAVAAFAGDPRFLPPLLERAGEANIYDAVALADLERVRALVAEDPRRATAAGENGWAPLRYCCESRLGESDPAAMERLLSIARLLLEHGASPDGLLDVAVYRNNAPLVRLLLERGATLQDGDTLNHAACDGAHEALDILVRAGVDLNKTEGTEHHGGYTPFGCALTLRSVRGAQWFLDHGIDPDYVGGGAGETSMHVAVRCGAAPQLLKLLLDRGASLDPRDSSGMTPLAAAKAKEHRSAVEFLTGIGAAD